MLFESLTDLEQLLVSCRHFLRQHRDRMWRTNTGNDIFTLRVNQILAVKYLFASCGVTSKRHTGSAAIPPITKHHRLNVDRRPPLVRNVVSPAIDDRPVVIPGTEHRTDCAPKLLTRILRESLPSALLYQLLKLFYQNLEIIRSQVQVFFDAGRVFYGFDNEFKWIMVFIFTLLYAHHNVTVHLQKPAIRIPGEPRVSALLGHNLDDVIVHAEVQNRIHHSRHRIARTGTYRQKQRIVAIAELFAN